MVGAGLLIMREFITANQISLYRERKFVGDKKGHLRYLKVAFSIV
tara:strand:+ start:2855 stop:2989 length:135 start_codon:yes stop_codon:yes gene_type:complete